MLERSRVAGLTIAVRAVLLIVSGSCCCVTASAGSAADISDPTQESRRIVDELERGVDLSGPGEAVVRRLVDQGIAPSDERIVEIGLRLYDRGYDSASAAVLAAHHLALKKRPDPLTTEPPAWKASHRVVLANGQLMKGIPADADASGFWLETEPGSRIRLESSEVSSLDLLEPGAST